MLRTVKYVVAVLCILVSFLSLGCTSEAPIDHYVYSQDSSKELYLLSCNDCLVTGPTGFSCTYVIDGTLVRLGTPFTQIDLVLLGNGSLLDPDGELWYRD